jgi:hypothetical protein
MRAVPITEHSIAAADIGISTSGIWQLRNFIAHPREI